jgi:predicted GIY-YIG superfamily endonuclease
VSATVYRLVGADGSTLYVGRTERMDRRTREHAARQPWSREIAHFEIVASHVPDHLAATVERAIGAALAPKYGNWAAATEPVEGTWLASAMHAAGITAKQLADRVEVSLAYVCDIRSGRSTLKRNPQLRERLVNECELFRLERLA